MAPDCAPSGQPDAPLECLEVFTAVSSAAVADRVDCPHATLCSGCALIREPYPEQLRLKTETLRRELARYPELGALEAAACVGAEPFSAYRVRAKLVISGRALGLFARGSHDVVDIPECRVLSPRLARAAAAIRRALPVPFELDAVDLREVDEGVLLTWIVPEKTPPGPLLDAARALQQEEPSVLGVALSPRPRESARVLGSLPEPLLGARSARHHLAPGEPFTLASFGSFVQAHGGQASKLYARVVTLLEERLGPLEDRPVLELYAGAGALALRLARAGARVTAVDSFEPAARALTSAAEAQGLRLSALATSAEEAIRAHAHGAAVVLDPPRRGLSPEVRDALGARRPPAVVYVSCEPRTLARDLAHLAWLGLAPRTATPFDMIPLSESVETVVALGPASPPEPRVLYASPLLLGVERPAHLPLAGERGLAAILRRAPGCSRATPLGPDDFLSGVALFARDANAAELLRPWLTKAVLQESALVRGIVREKGKIARPLGRRPKAREARARYRRERVVGTHSLVRVEISAEDAPALPRLFASIGHPVLGDAKTGHAPSNRYFVERHGLDRAFRHVSAMTLELPEGTVRLETPLAPDLVAVLQSLSGDT